MGNNRPYDFCGWATRANVKCRDGRTIMKDAFKDCDGKTVPLVWNHQHDSPFAVLGHALLENRPEGVFMKGYLNDSPQADSVRSQLKNGDIKAMSIYANDLMQRGMDVLHGAIREVSLVLAGANPKARIEDIVLAHGDDIPGEAVIYSGEQTIGLFHSEDKGEDKMANEKQPESGNGDLTTEEIKKRYNAMSEDEKEVVHALVGMALQNKGNKATDEDDEEDEEEDMKHNAFEGSADYSSNYLTHSDQARILDMAKEPGMTFQSALNFYAEQNGFELMHNDDEGPSGWDPDPTASGNISWLFPEYQTLGPKEPEIITNDRGWVGSVINGTSKMPFSRVRTRHVDIRNIDDLRAKGYQKGQKKDFVGNYNLVRRETDPQTIYVSSMLERDDVTDITDFDYIQWQYKIDRGQLEEELAMAILIGDRRADNVKGKINPVHIRPIWTDDELYTMHYDIDVEAMREKLQGDETGGYFGENFVYSEAMIEVLADARVKRRGSGTPDMYISPYMLNKLLLARDRNGRRIRATQAELATELGVGTIHTVEQFEDLVRTDGDNGRHKLLAIIGNMKDYGVGSTKGGQITHFTDFDIRFNELISLLETRLSGANTRVYSFIVLEEPVLGD